MGRWSVLEVLHAGNFADWAKKPLLCVGSSLLSHALLDLHSAQLRMKGQQQAPPTSPPPPGGWPGGAGGSGKGTGLLEREEQDIPLNVMDESEREWPGDSYMEGPAVQEKLLDADFFNAFEDLFDEDDMSRPPSAQR
jgi:hypothetical protein